MGEERTGEPQANRERLTVAQAAVRLGITEGAVRSRIKRGTLPTSKEGGNVFVVLGGSTSQANQATNIGVPGDQSELIDSLQDQIRFLREQLGAEREARTEERRRHDTIVAQLTSKIPAIEAPQEASEAAETVEETSDREAPRPRTGGDREDAGAKERDAPEASEQQPRAGFGRLPEHVAGGALAQLVVWAVPTLGVGALTGLASVARQSAFVTTLVFTIGGAAVGLAVALGVMALTERIEHKIAPSPGNARTVFAIVRMFLILILAYFVVTWLAGLIAPLISGGD